MQTIQSQNLNYNLFSCQLIGWHWIRVKTGSSKMRMFEKDGRYQRKEILSSATEFPILQKYIFLMKMQTYEIAHLVLK